MLEIRNVSKQYKVDQGIYETALDCVSMEFSKGDFGVILGHSGGGKSTLLNIMSGLDTSYEGDIYVNGENLRTLDMDGYHRTTVGFIFQNFHLVPHITVLENVKQALYLDDTLNDKKRTRRALELLRKVDLFELAKKHPTQLSGGQKQRVAIARALANNPDIIIADEPTGALDTATSREIITLLKDLADEGKTIIVVTHDKTLVRDATKVIILKDGKVALDRALITRQEHVHHKEIKRARVGLHISLRQAYMNFRKRKIRNILVALGTSIGITAILLALGMGNGIDEEIEKMFNSAFSPNEIFAYSKASQEGRASQALSEEQISKIKKVYKKEGIDEYYETRYLRHGVELQRGKYIYTGINQRVPLQEANRSKIRYENFTVESGFLSKGDMVHKDEEGIVVTYDAARGLYGKKEGAMLSEKELKKLVGSTITIRVTTVKDNVPTTVEYPVKVFGIISEASSSQMTYQLVSKDTFIHLFEKMNMKPQVYMITGYVDTPTTGTTFVDKYTGSKALQKYPEYDTIVFGNLSSMLESLARITDTITIVLIFVAGLSLTVAGVMIAIILYIGVIERTREIGVMRAMGYRRIHIRRLFIIESIYVVLLANGLSIIFALILEKFGNPLLEKTLDFQRTIHIVPSDMVYTLLITLTIGLLFSLYPAIKGANLDPATALRYE